MTELKRTTVKCHGKFKTSLSINRNGVAVQCDSLSRDAKEAYFIRNDTGDWLGFSEVIKLPHTDAVKKELGVSRWVKEFKQ